MKKFRNSILAVLLSLPLLVSAQSLDKAPNDWHHLDAGKDGISGVSTEQMYADMKGKKAKTVIVAVIDSGVDAEHEDLKDVMWVNIDEIPGNGIDDDKNGYIDDVHGWNFIGGKDGKNVHHDNLEITRLYRDLDKKYSNATASNLSKKEKKEYEKYKKMGETIKEKQEENAGNVMLYQGLLDAVTKLEMEIGKEDITKEDLENFESDDPMISRAAAILTNVLGQGGDLKGFKKQVEGGVKHFSSQVDYYYNPDFDPRKIVGDNYRDTYQKVYGNNNVEGPDAGHGTHVAGIIAATRGNGVGMDGIAKNARIMSIRTVPDGDERDKDVANAIIYAVDNGASIINMSFGKGYSYDKEAVDKAVKYAYKNDVLLVHAAGNSNQDNDGNDNFPNDKYQKRGLFKPKMAKNWLEIGALSWKSGEDAPAVFSNYGKDNVDIFSPGVDIYSTTPDDKYEHFDGTSMAAPVTAGIAAAIRGYYPELSAEQIKDAIMRSAVKVNQSVKKPGTDTMVPFSDLCRTGGVVNAKKAMKLASTMKGKSKKAKKWKSASGVSGGSGSGGSDKKPGRA
mgnify:CR=1 FL=1